MLQWNFLAEDIDDGTLLIDCRSEDSYEAGTLRGALGAAFIKKPFGSGAQSAEKLTSYLKPLLEKVSGKPVVLFDEGQGMYASRLAWLLSGMELTNVKIYSKKFADIESGKLGKGAGQIIAAPVTGKPLTLPNIVNITFLQQNLTKVQLLDVRTPEEYSGKIPRMSNPEAGAICGRIPGSLNWDWRALYGLDGGLRPKGEIVHDVKRIGLMPERPTVIYDYNGARSCTTALILSRLGYRQVHVYLGSWMEWRKSKLPKQNMGTWLAG